MGQSYTETIQYAVGLDDYLYNNPAQVLQEFRQFYKSFLTLYLATNNLLLNSESVIGRKKVDENEFKELFNTIEQWITNVKVGVFRGGKPAGETRKQRPEGTPKNQPNDRELMQEGIVLFNDYCNRLIRYGIIRID